jgi:hypothetical protein
MPARLPIAGSPSLDSSLRDSPLFAPLYVLFPRRGSIANEVTEIRR